MELVVAVGNRLAPIVYMKLACLRASMHWWLKVGYCKQQLLGSSVGYILVYSA